METEFEYSSTQINIPDPLAGEILHWGRRNIPDQDLHVEDEDKTCDGMGREEVTHCTVLYGIHSADPKGVSDLLKDHGPIVLKLGKVTIFRTKPDYDVVKLSVHSEGLHDLHEALLAKIPNSWQWPEYKPHITIAYVGPGKADHVDGDDTFEGREVLAQGVLFSSKDGRKVTIHLGDANMHSSKVFAEWFVRELNKAADFLSIVPFGTVG